MSGERRWRGPAWGVYLVGSFHCGVYWTRREAEQARRELVAESYGRLGKDGAGLRFWQAAYQVDRVSVMATPAVLSADGAREAKP